MNPINSGESTSHRNVYEIVTEQIIRQLGQGVAPWRKPWRTELPANLVSGKPYRGLNVFLLGSQGYGSRYWLTFNQAAKLGGHIRKGERSSMVTFWHMGEEKIIRDADGKERKSKPFLLRYYRVFNVEQTEGIADKLGLTGASPRFADLSRSASWLWHSSAHHPSSTSTPRKLSPFRSGRRWIRTQLNSRTNRRVP